MAVQAADEAAQAEANLELVYELEEEHALLVRRMWKQWNKCKQDPDAAVEFDPEVAAEHFAKVGKRDEPELSQFDEDLIRSQVKRLSPETLAFLRSPFTASEVKRACQKFSSSTAADITGKIAVPWRYLSDATYAELAGSYSAQYLDGFRDWTSSERPALLKSRVAIMHILYKKRGKIMDLNNHRGIVVCSVSTRLPASLGNTRLTDAAHAEEIIGRSQVGFATGHETPENIMVRRTIQETLIARPAYDHQSEIFGVAYDMKKAYPGLFWKLVKVVFDEMGIPLDSAPMGQLVAFLHRGRLYCVKTRSGLSEPFALGNGLGEGDIGSPLIFNIIYEVVGRVFAHLFKSKSPVRSGPLGEIGVLLQRRTTPFGEHGPAEPLREYHRSNRSLAIEDFHEAKFADDIDHYSSMRTMRSMFSAWTQTLRKTAMRKNDDKTEVGMISVPELTREIRTLGNWSDRETDNKKRYQALNRARVRLSNWAASDFWSKTCARVRESAIARAAYTFAMETRTTTKRELVPFNSFQVEYLARQGTFGRYKFERIQRSIHDSDILAHNLAEPIDIFVEHRRLLFAGHCARMPVDKGWAGALFHGQVVLTSDNPMLQRCISGYDAVKERFDSGRGDSVVPHAFQLLANMEPAVPGLELGSTPALPPRTVAVLMRQRSLWKVLMSERRLRKTLLYWQSGKHFTDLDLLRRKGVLMHKRGLLNPALDTLAQIVDTRGEFIDTGLDMDGDSLDSPGVVRSNSLVGMAEWASSSSSWSSACAHCGKVFSGIRDHRFELRRWQPNNHEQTFLQRYTRLPAAANAVQLTRVFLGDLSDDIILPGRTGAPAPASGIGVLIGHELSCDKNPDAVPICTPADIHRVRRQEHAQFVMDLGRAAQDAIDAVNTSPYFRDVSNSPACQVPRRVKGLIAAKCPYPIAGLPFLRYKVKEEPYRALVRAWPQMITRRRIYNAFGAYCLLLQFRRLERAQHLVRACKLDDPFAPPPPSLKTKPKKLDPEKVAKALGADLGDAWIKGCPNSAVAHHVNQERLLVIAQEGARAVRRGLPKVLNDNVVNSKSTRTLRFGRTKKYRFEVEGGIHKILCTLRPRTGRGANRTHGKVIGIKVRYLVDCRDIKAGVTNGTATAFRRPEGHEYYYFDDYDNDPAKAVAAARDWRAKNVSTSGALIEGAEVSKKRVGRGIKDPHELRPTACSLARKGEYWACRNIRFNEQTKMAIMQNVQNVRDDGTIQQSFLQRWNPLWYGKWGHDSVAAAFEAANEYKRKWVTPTNWMIPGAPTGNDKAPASWTAKRQQNRRAKPSIATVGAFAAAACRAGNPLLPKKRGRPPGSKNKPK